MTNKHIELPALLPCPFCGDDAVRSRTMDESLWSHETVPYHKVHCPSCEIGTEYRCEGYEPTAEESWNSRAAHEQARVVGEPVAWAATSEDGKVEALGFNQSRRFDTPLVFASPPAPQEAQAEQAEAPSHRPSPEWYREKIAETLDDDFSIGPATQTTASNAGERELDLYDEIECDMPSLFGRASLEGHESGQRLAHQVRTKMQAARAALASKPPQAEQKPVGEIDLHGNFKLLCWHVPAGTKLYATQTTASNAGERELVLGRPAFEVAIEAKKRGWSLATVTVNGKFHAYSDPDIDNMWIGWCYAVRAALASKPVAPAGQTDKVLAYLDDLKDDAAAHIYPSDLEKCGRMECVVEVVSVRAGNGDEETVPLFSRDQVAEALRAARGDEVNQK